ncbi:MAG: hypothetical protein IOD10_20845, partial [Rhodocyclaceae bacterium]|nr:hypothetical protein [Rhodocyclaceae bacterium]
SMSATGSLVISGFGTLQARVTIVPPPVEEAGGGGARWVDEYLEEQQRIADKIRSQNQAIVAMVVSLAISEGAE